MLMHMTIALPLIPCALSLHDAVHASLSLIAALALRVKRVLKPSMQQRMSVLGTCAC